MRAALLLHGLRRAGFLWQLQQEFHTVQKHVLLLQQRLCRRSVCYPVHGLPVSLSRQPQAKTHPHRDAVDITLSLRLLTSPDVRASCATGAEKVFQTALLWCCKTLHSGLCLHLLAPSGVNIWLGPAVSLVKPCLLVVQRVASAVVSFQKNI